jgi:hypothetical protein
MEREPDSQKVHTEPRILHLPLLMSTCNAIYQCWASNLIHVNLIHVKHPLYPLSYTPASQQPLLCYFTDEVTWVKEVVSAHITQPGGGSTIWIWVLSGRAHIPHHFGAHLCNLSDYKIKPYQN